MTSLGVNSTSILNGNATVGAFDVEIEHPVSIRNRFGIALLFFEPLAAKYQLLQERSSTATGLA